MSTESNKRVRRRLIYQGRVQGVGFRYTVASIARRFPVTGYVKNLPDGNVELAVDGEFAPVEAFLNEISVAFAGNIEKTLSEELDFEDAFHGFRIRY